MVTLSAREQLKLEILVKVMTGLMTPKTGAQILEVDPRTFRRYLKAYREKDVLSVKHGNCHKTPHNKTCAEIKLMVLNLIKEKYFDFNILHLQEKLIEEGLKIKRETLRKWCHEIGMVKRSKRRRSHPRYHRDRMSQAGMMIQFDGSHHRWFDGRETCLLAAIDDATNEVYARFYEGETTFACLDVLKAFVKEKGCFKTLYVNKAGVYGGVKREGFSQVQRALGELDTHTLFAHSPQAKGRVERLFNTLQDRLVAEMRLNKIRTIQQANDYLQNVYLPSHNARFMVLPRNMQSLYRPIHPSWNVDEVFCVKEYRLVGKDHTISWLGDKYMIADQLKYSISNQKLEIRLFEKQPWKCFFAGRELKLVKVEKVKKLAA
jgi:transposase